LSVFAGSIVQIAVERSGRTAGALIVKCRTVDDTAKASQDFLVETLLQARMDDGTNQASINISTLNAQRNQAVGFGFEIESVKSECVPGDGKFECAGKLNSTSSKAVVMIERSAGICGDGIRGLGETCDDGNVAMEDGCSQMCTVETGFSCDYASGKDICTTPKANGTTPKANGTTPKASNCGNGIRDLDETCDDGNTYRCNISCVSLLRIVI
jgi:cysteine-rich repeat protein